MSFAPSPSAGDRYRLQMTKANMLQRIRGKAVATVAIVDTSGLTVWERKVATVGEAHELADLIRSQVFSADLRDFEHWLNTEGAER